MSTDVTWLDRKRNIIFSVITLLTVGGAGAFYFQQPSSEPIVLVTAQATATDIPTTQSTLEPTATLGVVRVYITGAVVSSDVYYLTEGSIIKDLILAAGGMTTDADPERINQATELKDQQHIHVPRLDEEIIQPVIQDAVTEENNAQNFDPPANNNMGLVNINTATLEELDTLPGIGPSLGQRIIQYREQVRGFTSVESITEVGGIGDATFQKIKPFITVE